MAITIVEFYATWCTPCKLMTAVIQKAQMKYKDITFVRVNVDKETGVAVENDIMAIPTVKFFKDDKSFGTHVGVIGEGALEQKIEEMCNAD